MTPDQIASLKAEILSGITIAGSVASGIAPQYGPLILVAESVAKLIPGLTGDVINLVQKQAPSLADAASLATQIAALSHPEAL